MKRGAALLIFSIALLCRVSTAAIAAEHHRLSYRDLNEPRAIIGPLGLELGRAAECEVEKRIENTKEGTPFLVVTAINGKRLSRPVSLPFEMLVIADSMLPGRRYRVRAYQDGCFTGIPAEVLREVMVQTTDHHFMVRLVVYRIIEK